MRFRVCLCLMFPFRKPSPASIMKRFTVFIIGFSLLLSGRVSAQKNTSPNERVVATTEAGMVRGQRVAGVTVFRSVPYAAPPVGNLRFAVAARHKPWPGVRDARKAGPTVPFPLPADVDIAGQPVFGPGWVKGDDYLTTNIWTPGLSAKRLPVMVFIHGGAFVLGTGNGPLYDGANFARKGVVLVTLNYRLGIEGFLKIDGVPSNLGIRDQLAALRWVKANIAGFGGDPDNVTIFGESAGAMSVGVLLASPAAEGLFKRGIMMSGSGQAVLSGEQADRIANKYAEVLNITNTREAYRKFSPEALLTAQRKVTPKMVKLETEEYADPTGGLVLFFPVIDGDIVPDLPLRSVQKGAGDGYDVLVGYNTDEVNYFLVPTGLMKKIRLNVILDRAVRIVHPAPSAVIATYKTAYPDMKLGELFSKILTAYQFQVPSVRFADAHAKLPGKSLPGKSLPGKSLPGKTYMYEFGWKSSVAKGVYGAYHGIGLPFVFNNTRIVTGQRGMLGPGGAPTGLADKVQTAWVNFAKTGNPGWDAYAPGERKTMLINATWQLQTNPHADELKSWDGVR